MAAEELELVIALPGIVGAHIAGNSEAVLMGTIC